jgi:hypothetical protein
MRNDAQWMSDMKNTPIVSGYELALAGFLLALMACALYDVLSKVTA